MRAATRPQGLCRRLVTFAVLPARYRLVGTEMVSSVHATERLVSSRWLILIFVVGPGVRLAGAQGGTTPGRGRDHRRHPARAVVVGPTVAGRISLPVRVHLHRADPNSEPSRADSADVPDRAGVRLPSPGPPGEQADGRGGLAYRYRIAVCARADARRLGATDARAAGAQHRVLPVHGGRCPSRRSRFSAAS